MSTDATPKLQLPYILAAQAQKHVTHNEAIRSLDAVVQLSVISKSLATPPVSPVDGDCYIVAAAPTGAWTGQATRIAAYYDGSWRFVVPAVGWLAWVAADSTLNVYSAGAWADYILGAVSGKNLASIAQLGVNATPDATNRLSVSSPASLFNHVGNGHQAKINKNAAGDTASFLFQTNFSGRAEMGTTGDDDFHFKVSPDGASWFNALLIDRSTGKVTCQHRSREQQRRRQADHPGRDVMPPPRSISTASVSSSKSRPEPTPAALWSSGAWARPRSPP